MHEGALKRHPKRAGVLIAAGTLGLAALIIMSMIFTSCLRCLSVRLPLRPATRPPQTSAEPSVHVDGKVVSVQGGCMLLPSCCMDTM